MSNLYTGAMGMITFENKMNVIGNNIANAKTTGYKKDMDTAKVFEESFMRIISNNEDHRIGPYQNQVHTDQVHTNYNQGTMKFTNRSLDLAINDAHTNNNDRNFNFFEVEQSGETFLTRDGHFQLDSDGNLNTSNGYFVLNSQGEKVNLSDVENFSINEEGEVIDNSDGNILDTIQIRTVNESNLPFLQKYGQNNFQVMTLEELEANFGPIEDVIETFGTNISLQRILKNEDTLIQSQMNGMINIFEEEFTGVIKQGMLEESNINISNEMTSLLSAQKGFTSSSKVLSVMDKINEKDANQLGA